MRRLVLALVLCAAAPGAASITRSIDPQKSTAQFSVSHIWVENVKGAVPITGGVVVLPQGSRIPTSVTAELDATKIATDEPDRDRDLVSPDFFDTAKFPRWNFISTSIVPSGPDAFEMDGNLTIHGVTRSERLNVRVSGANDALIYHATTQIDRHAFGMATTRLDPTIGGTVDITLDIGLK